MKAEFASGFDVAEERAWRDLDNFVEELLRLGLVEVTQEATAHELVGGPEKEKKSYQAPQLEHEEEIAVAAAFSPSV